MLLRAPALPDALSRHLTRRAPIWRAGRVPGASVVFETDDHPGNGDKVSACTGWQLGNLDLEPIRITGIIASMNEEQTTKRTRARTPNNKTTTGFRISDALWAVLQPLLPVHVNKHRFGGGRPRKPDRVCGDAIFYVLRTGCQWKALDQTELCPGSTAHDRFQEWVQADVFLKLWQAGVEQFDELKGLDWDWLSMDGAITKAPLGGEKNRAQPD